MSTTFLKTLILLSLLAATSLRAQSFSDVSTSVGLSSINYPTFGSPTWTDIDNDGNLDILVINHGQNPSLMHNYTGSAFTDIVSISGITTGAGGDRHGSAWGDFDNDGDKDLFITLGGGGVGGSKKLSDQLYRNDGTGYFTDIAEQAGVTNDYGRGRNVNLVDFDSDGLLDIFLNNLKTDNLLLKNNGDSTFTDVAAASGVIDDTGAKTAWSDYDKDGDMDFFTTGDTDQLWQNNGDGTFTEVTLAAGMRHDSSGQSIAWGDYNNDGYNDLFVARGFNDTMGAMLEGAKVIGFNAEITSADFGLESGIDFSTNGQQVTFDLYVDACREVNAVFLGGQSTVPLTTPFTVRSGEVRNKPLFIAGEDFGFFIWRDTDGWHLRWSHDSNGRSPKYLGKITTSGQFSDVEGVNYRVRDHNVINTLYQNNGDGTFTDVTASAGVEDGSNNRGAVWGDYDNDGDIDLYVVNSGDFLGNGNNKLYKNLGNGSFRNVARTTGVSGLVDGRGDGAAWGDFNNNGSLDLYVTNGANNPVISQAGTDTCLVHGPHIFYENTNYDNQWLKLTLVGTSSNRDGLGAKISLTSAGASQYYEHNGGASYFSQGAGPVHFGLGSNTVVDELTIDWPSGNTQILTNIAVGQHITIEEE